MSAFGGINFLAVAVAAFVTLMVGGMWYTALFGKRWAQLHGFTREQVVQMQKQRPPAMFFSGMLACYLVVAFVLALLFAGDRVTSAASGALAGFLLWLGFSAAIRMTDHLASAKPIGVYLIDTSFQLIFLVLMGAIIGGWK